MNKFFKESSFYRVKEIGSTNTFLMENCENLENYYALLADRQTNGKGRLGRNWSSDENQGMYFSFLIKEFPANWLLQFPLAIAISEVKALAALGVKGVKIKWPNDIVLEQKKLGGVLCESKHLENGVCVVVGMGINVNQSTAYFEHNNLPYGGSVFSLTGKKIAREVLAKEILKQVDTQLDLLHQNKLDIISQYKPLCVNLNREVKLLYKDKEEYGYAQDIAPNGALVVATKAGKTIEVSAGEVSVRGLYGYV